jgi:hypothetical protein
VSRRQNGKLKGKAGGRERPTTHVPPRQGYFGGQRRPRMPTSRNEPTMWTRARLARHAAARTVTKNVMPVFALVWEMEVTQLAKGHWVHGARGRGAMTCGRPGAPGQRSWGDVGLVEKDGKPPGASLRSPTPLPGPPVRWLAGLLFGGWPSESLQSSISRRTKESSNYNQVGL